MGKMLSRKAVLLVTAVLGHSVGAFAVTIPTAPAGFCQNAPATLIAAINAVLATLGLGPIC